jgi:hypothetical protein
MQCNSYRTCLYICIALLSGNNRRRCQMQGVRPDVRNTDIYSAVTNCKYGQPRLPMTLHMCLEVHSLDVRACQ